MKEKIIKFFLFSNVGLVILALVILIPILMIYSFFGGEISDSGYVEGNMEYADLYESILNNNITITNNGYVPLSRIVYFWKENPDLDMEEIYNNNLDLTYHNLKPISDVCDNFYASLNACLDENIEISKQSNSYPYKPFSRPIDFSLTTITSYFGKERIVFEKEDIHYAWDFASVENTPIYSVGDGKVVKVRFNQNKNETDTSNGLGNYIEIEYVINEVIYHVIYAHLYPNSSTLKEDDLVYNGEEIAGVGTTGYSTGNHLHFEVRIGNDKVDGLNLVDFCTSENCT